MEHDNVRLLQESIFQAKMIRSNDHMVYVSQLLCDTNAEIWVENLCFPKPMCPGTYVSQYQYLFSNVS